jgi:hypothetical protein
MASTDFSTSLVRTLTPIIVGTLGAYGTRYLGLTTSQLTPLVGGGLSFLYYVAARTLEHQWPALGALLGAPQEPLYPSGLSQAAQQAVEAAVTSVLALESQRSVSAPSAPNTIPIGITWADIEKVRQVH